MSHPVAGNLAVADGIRFADLAGRHITDTEVAALAAGVLAPTDLVVPVLNGVAQLGGMTKEASSSSEAERESDEESSEEEPSPPRGGNAVAVATSPQDEKADIMDVDKEIDGGESGGANKGKGKGKGDTTVDQSARQVKEEEKGELDDSKVADGGVKVLEESGDESPSDSDDVDVQPRKSKNAAFPKTGPLTRCPAGDVSDGEDDDISGGAIPMTRNEAEEPILPLGEVSMNGAEVLEVGTILSLVEADGTIVIRGTPGKPPLDEGSVLSALSEKEGDEGGSSKEPLGRIHEIFGPCAIPHYTVRVEGAAAKHQQMLQYQTAKKKLLEEEENRSAASKVGSDAEMLTSMKKEDVEMDDVDMEAAVPPTVSQPSEAAQKAGVKKVESTAVDDKKLTDLKRAVEAAEEAMGEMREHPFRRWKAGATVYALKNHAKFLAKELLVPSGKGTDASNCHDEEAQDEEFSDDEQERLAKAKGKVSKKRSDLAMQGVLPREIDAIMLEEEQRRTKTRGGSRGGRGRRGGRGDTGRGGRGERDGGRDGQRGHRGGQTGNGYHGATGGPGYGGVVSASPLPPPPPPPPPPPHQQQQHQQQRPLWSSQPQQQPYYPQQHHMPNPSQYVQQQGYPQQLQPHQHYAPQGYPAQVPYPQHPPHQHAFVSPYGAQPVIASTGGTGYAQQQAPPSQGSGTPTSSSTTAVPHPATTDGRSRPR